MDEASAVEVARHGGEVARWRRRHGAPARYDSQAPPWMPPRSLLLACRSQLRNGDDEKRDFAAAAAASQWRFFGGLDGCWVSVCATWRDNGMRLGQKSRGKREQADFSIWLTLE